MIINCTINAHFYLELLKNVVKITKNDSYLDIFTNTHQPIALLHQHFVERVTIHLIFDEHRTFFLNLK